MKKTVAAKHLGTTILAHSPTGRRDLDRYTEPAVVLSVEMWDWTYSHHTGAETLKRSCSTKASRHTYYLGGVGWLALVATRPENGPLLPDLAARMIRLPVDDLLAFGLPDGVRLRTVQSTSVHSLTWEELGEKRQRAAEWREEESRRVAVIHERQKQARIHLTRVTDTLGVGRHLFAGTSVQVLELLERLARAEGVELPPRPEHLRDA